MELGFFFKLLKKYKLVLIFIPIITGVATFFAVKRLPDTYVSHAQIATGIVDASRHLLDKDANNSQQAQQAFSEFSNLMAIMKLKKIVSQVSYSLIIHDLQYPAYPYSKPSKMLADMAEYQRDAALKLFQYKFNHLEPLLLYNKQEKTLNDLLHSMRYDDASLRKDLVIYRDDESDFISVSYDSANPQLSADVVNILCTQFINYYSQTVKKNESNAVTFLSDLLVQKRNALRDKTAQLQKYKIDNGILNLEEQSRAIFGQILSYSDKKQEAEKEIAAYDGTLKTLDSKFAPADRQYFESVSSKINQTITATQDELHLIQNKYIRSNYDPKYKPALDSIQKSLSSQINLSSDQYITNPLTHKDDLVKQKLTLEVTRDLAKYSVQSINAALSDLNAKFARLVPFDAKVKTFDFDINIASQEYLDVLNKYNSTNLKSNFSIELIQVEKAEPEAPEPSKKMLLIVISVVVMFFVCVFVLFVLFYLDNTIKEPAELVNKTQLPLLGYLNRIPGTDLDIRKLWDIENRDKMQQYKDLLRSVRFEIDQELRGEKIIAVTSISPHEGKTLFATSLAYSYAMINKKVLLIDGNFERPDLTNAVRPNLFLEDYFKNTPLYNVDVNSSTATTLGNHGNDITLLEIADEAFIKNRFDDLKSKYDIVIIDTAPLTALNKSKEWLLFADKTVAVFEANKELTNAQKQFVVFLKTLGSKFGGWVLNKTTVSKKRK
ncbi:AAA family ATPase [Mucilaginibacter ginsenosidivorax]|uniref:AAA family ATPase n=1 Tax=Mucilaginibacter ginsenosidivorax TaxID=862126 RepID=A0A5B8VSC5_9SPHI|nr:AAA family ATPase [Mucilaginibacter ginsenosidivorax]QEC74507.1 AAA family ATPase [Mucilaginibacter ginsenosidivorax]